MLYAVLKKIQSINLKVQTTKKPEGTASFFFSLTEVNSMEEGCEIQHKEYTKKVDISQPKLQISLKLRSVSSSSDSPNTDYFFCK